MHKGTWKNEHGDSAEEISPPAAAAVTTLRRVFARKRSTDTHHEQKQRLAVDRGRNGGGIFGGEGAG